MFCCYILHSKSIDRYYVGETNSMEERLNQHNHSFFENSYTKQADDWTVVLQLECKNRIHARKVEAHIKQMKSRDYIENLKKYPEMRQKLISRFSNEGSGSR
ncbi:MAG: GIY-YIG nuclease family protein [Flavobacteriales bacterium]